MRLHLPPEEKLFGALQTMTQDQCVRIHDGAVEVLERTGVRFDDPEACEQLAEAGASVVGSQVRIPRAMVEHAAACSPERITLGAQAVRADLELGNRRFLTTNGFGTTVILDAQSGARRPTVAADLARLTRIADQLPEVSFCQHQVTPTDLRQDLLDVAQAFIVLSQTGKHAHLSTYTARYIDEVIELGRIAGDGRSAGSEWVFSLGCCSLSPLVFPKEATILLRRCAAEGIPFLVVSGAIAGVTAPVTLAGALVVQTAEHLAALTLAQSVREGAPVAFGSFTSPMDPRDGRQRLGAAELGLLNGATAAMCRTYRVPFGYGTGGVTDSTEIGIQTGIEKSVTTLSAALAGVEVIHDAVSGILDSGRMVCYEQMVIDAEICRIVRHYVRGMTIDDEMMALSEIEALGAGGNYLTSEHTANHFREEILIGGLFGGGDASQAAALRRAAERVTQLAEAERETSMSREGLREMVQVWSRSARWAPTRRWRCSPGSRSCCSPTSSSCSPR